MTVCCTKAESDVETGLLLCMLSGSITGAVKHLPSRSWQCIGNTYCSAYVFSPYVRNNHIVTFWVLSCFCLLLRFSLSLLVSVSLVFCHVLALEVPSYVFVLMLEIWARSLPESLSHVSVTSGSDAVSVDLPSLLVFWCSSCYLIYIIIISPVLCRS